MEIKTKGIELPNGDSYVFIPPTPTETESGGIKAKNKTNENREIAVDPETGKAYVYVDDKADKETVKQTLAALTDKTNTLAPGIVLDAKGNTVEINNASEQPFVGLNVYGKSTQAKTTGVQLWDNDAAMNPDFWQTEKAYKYVNLNLKPNTTYTLSVDQNNMHNRYKPEYVGNFAFYIGEAPGVSNPNSLFGNTNSDMKVKEKIFTTTDKPFYFNLFCNKWDTENIKIALTELLQNMMLVEGDTTKPYEPYTGGTPSPNPEYPQEIVNVGDNGEINVNIYGKNRVHISDIELGYGERSFECYIPTTFTVSVQEVPTKITKNIWRIRFEYKNGDYQYAVDGNFPATIKVTPDNPITRISVRDTNIESGKYSGIQIELGSTATDYEPYKPVQTLTLATPNGLAGIPVTSGGNYVDENGQQWMTDEIDLARGVRIQRIEKHIFGNNDSFAIDTALDEKLNRFSWREYQTKAKNETPIMCCIFKFSGFSELKQENLMHGAKGASRCFVYVDKNIDSEEKFKALIDGKKVFYVLAEPIITPLTPEEIAAYKELHTYSPNTTITNDGGCGMSMEYIADTQKYFGSIENGVNDFVSIKKEIDKNKKDIAFLTETTMSWSDWFDLHRTGWHGGVTYPRSKVSTTTLGTKTGDNANMVIEVSTNETKGRNDFTNSPATNLLFNGIEVNGFIDEDGEPHITAVKGSQDFSRDGSNGDVYMAFLTPFYKRIYSEEVDGWDFSDHPIPGYKPWDAAVRPDGTYRSFYFMTKYPGVEGPDGNVASISGKKLIRNVSHNNQIEKIRKKGSQYCGMTSVDVAWTQWMMDMKFANRSSTAVMSGCTSYWHQVPAVIEEDNVKRIIIPKANASKLIVGSCVSIGYGTVINGENKPDRAYANTHAYADDVKILSIEDYDTDNNAVYVDAPEPFSTRQVKLDDTITSPVYLTSMYWQSGACDNVLGCDGSPANPTKQEYPFILSGVELGHGGYVVIADVIMDGVYNAESDVYTQTPCIVRDSRKIATSITSDYVRAGYNLPDTNNTGQYISDLGYDAKLPWLTLPIAFGASSSTCYGDYINTGARAKGLREWLWFGSMGYGGGPGLRYVHSASAVSSAGWSLSLRLSSLRH